MFVLYIYLDAQLILPGANTGGQDRGVKKEEGGKERGKRGESERGGARERVTSLT